MLLWLSETCQACSHRQIIRTGQEEKSLCCPTPGKVFHETSSLDLRIFPSYQQREEDAVVSVAAQQSKCCSAELMSPGIYIAVGLHSPCMDMKNSLD